MLESLQMHHFEDLPQRLASLLERKKMTQKELHERSGVALSRISDYVNGKGSPPTLPTLARILEALDCSRSELFSTDDPGTDPAQPSVEQRLDSIEEQTSYIEARLGGVHLELDRRFKDLEKKLGLQSASGDDERRPT